MVGFDILETEGMVDRLLVADKMFFGVIGKSVLVHGDQIVPLPIDRQIEAVLDEFKCNARAMTRGRDAI